MLQNAHILITRPQGRAARLSNDLRTRGAIPILYPGFAFGPCDNIMLLDAELAKLTHGDFDSMILTSGHAARVITERIAEIEVSLADQIVWTVGNYTAAACQFEAQIQTPAQARDARTLLEALPDIQGKRILLPQSPLAAPTLAQGLIERGAEVTIVHPYSVIKGEGGDEVPDLIRQNRIHALTFFSGSAVEGVISRLESAGLSLEDVKHIPAVCFGASTASLTRDLGLVVWEGDATYETFYSLLEEACQP